MDQGQPRYAISVSWAFSQVASISTCKVPTVQEYYSSHLLVTNDALKEANVCLMRNN